MDYSAAKTQLRRLEKQLYALAFADSAIYLDSVTVAPPDTAEGRGEALGELSAWEYALFVTDANRELFASRNADRVERLGRNIELLEDRELRGLLARVEAGLTRYEAGSYRMTDDKAPVELLSMRVIDELIRDELAYYKGVYAQYGLKGIIGSL